ncbi:MAG TPA: hypothetical protein VHT52_17990 [Stellaceae bacterium]|jgi:hypothetical protein|nr:hypothetical protein [Stellaceae bacterium]
MEHDETVAKAIEATKRMIDTHDETVEIKITRDPGSGYRVWIHVGSELAVRVYRAALLLDGVQLPLPMRTPVPEDDDAPGK